MDNIDILVKSPDGLDRLASVVGGILGVSSVIADRNPGRRFELAALELDFSLLDEHGMVNDGDVEYEAYPLRITVLARWSVEIVPGYGDMATAITMYLAARISHLLACETLIVHDFASPHALFRRGAQIGATTDQIMFSERLPRNP